MAKKYKYVNVFKKTDNILKYSSVYTGMTKKEQKVYFKSNNTLILDKPIYYGLRGGVGYIDLKTLIIDKTPIKEDSIKKITLEINECTATDIYIDGHDNLGGITIPYDYFIDNYSAIKFIWGKDKKVNISKINIVFSDKSITIDVNLLERIILAKSNESILLMVENYNSYLDYKIDNTGKIDKIYKAREIHASDVENKVLDLRKYKKYEKLYFYNLNFDKLIINKDNINKIFNYEEIFRRTKFKTLEIIDDNDMKLIPTNKNIDTNHLTLEKGKNEYYGNFIRMGNNGYNKILYVDKNDEIILLNQDYFKEKYNAIKSKIYYERNYFNGYTRILILIEMNDNIYKVIIDDKEYILSNMFKEFLLLNKDNYLKDEMIEDINNSNWFNIIGQGNFNHNGFLKIYNDYLDYELRIKKLKELGFSEKALKYLYDKNINTIINTETIEGLREIEDIKDYEVNAYNLIGEEYIKVLKK